MRMERKPEGLLFNELEDIEAVKVLTDRVKKRKQVWLEAKPMVSAGRLRTATRSWKETDGEHLYIRRAKLFAKICEEAPIAIFDGELIVGSQTQYIRGCSPFDDWDTAASDEVISGMKNVGASEVVEFGITDEDLEIIKEDNAFWRGKSPVNRMLQAINQHFGIDISELSAPGVTPRSVFVGTWANSRAADYETVLEKGVGGIIKDAEAKLEALKFENGDDIEKWNFIQAAIITLRGMITYANRYAKLARELASREESLQRKRELERIAQTCEWVPENPARNFYEAVQSVRFIHLGLNLETAGSMEHPVRMDQYLLPFYERDMKEGNLTPQEAAEILACFMLKMNEMDNMRPGFWRETGAGNHGTHITIGGVDREEKDAANELSYIILKVAKELKLRVAVYARVHEGTPNEFLVKCIECNRVVGGGIPAFLNDKRIIANFIEDGVTIEDARGYAGLGCLHAFIPSCSSLHGGAGPSLNGPKVLELVMYNGWDPRTKKQVGLQTGDPRSFTSIEDWIEAWQKQMTYFRQLFQSIFNFAWHMRSQVYELPFASALVNDCLEKGKGVLRGGTRYPQLLMPSFDHVRANTGDSLMAIKKLVYDEKKLTVDEILDACAHNFEGDGREQIRWMLLAAPKYGNDEDEPDELMKRVSVWNSLEVRACHNPYGYPTSEFRHGASAHYQQGRFVGALPDGRKAYGPLADGGISPMAGNDNRGPTAVLRSAYKIVDIHANRETVLNQKFSPSLVSTRENIMKAIAMIRTYFEDYLGYMIQYNILDRAQLLAAKEHPEEYRELVVRVGGYSAYFVELPPDLQDEIIARTDQQF